jgi:alpha-N-arabinofuranosidase
MQNAVRNMDALSLHYYTIAGPGWGNKTAATGFGEDLYFSGLRKGLHIQDLVKTHSLLMDQYDPRKRVGLYVDEWGIWTDVEPGTNPGHLFQQNSMRDALIASTTLDIFNRNAERVKMANIAQTVNVLQSMVLTQGAKMVLTPTYHVFNMYKVHGDAILMPSSIVSEKYSLGNESIPAISQTVSMDASGKMHLTLSNLNPNKEIKLTVELIGKTVAKVNTASCLTAPQFNSVNTFDKPETVRPVEFKAYKILSGNLMEIILPGKSLVTLEME